MSTPPRMYYDGEPTPCDCPCHAPVDGVALDHFMACCQPCRHCGARFRAGLDAHERTCRARPP